MNRSVYFIRPVGMAGPIKIGSSANPERRLCGLMAWSPFPLEIVVRIPASPLLEKSLHAYFADAHTHHEWFLARGDLLALIDGLKIGIPLSKLIDLADASLRRKTLLPPPKSTICKGRRINASPTTNPVTFVRSSVFGCRTHEAFAHVVGVRQPTVTRWEAAGRIPSFQYDRIRSRVPAGQRWEDGWFFAAPAEKEETSA